MGRSFFLQNNFPLEQRTSVSKLFHKWARQPAFATDPKRLLDKVGHVAYETLATKAKPGAPAAGRAALQRLAGLLNDPEAAAYAGEVQAWEAQPEHEKAMHALERAQAFAAAGGAAKMGAAPPSDKQLGYLRSLGCARVPASKQEACDLITQFKKR